MQPILQRLRSFRFSPGFVPLFLAGVCVLAYGLLIPWLGYYWDEWAYTWIYDRLGPAGLTRYFSTNRPVWGLFYQVNFALLGAKYPLVWQLFGLFWRWASAVIFWALVRLAWPRREEIALTAAVLFLVYPGFSQQPIALMYGHFFIIISVFLFSLYATLRFAGGGRLRWVWFAIALFMSTVNLLAMEYFYLLEVLRPVLIWLALEKQGLAARRRAVRSGLIWLPFVTLMAGVALWRSFFFGFHTYQPVLLQDLRADFWAAILDIIQQALNGIWVATLAAWGSVFSFPDPKSVGMRILSICIGGVVAAGIVSLVFWLFFRPGGQKPGRWLISFFVAGVLALGVAGGPYLLIKLPILISFPNDRFTLSFMIGASLVLAGLLALIPGPRWVRGLFLAALVGLAAGKHIQTGFNFRRDWDVTQKMFWQMAWRMPDLQPGTTIISNELPIHYSSDNSLTAPLNWMYAPENTSPQMSFMFYYPTVRLGAGLPGLEKGLPIHQDYLASSFDGNTSQVVGIYFNPPACLRVMDPELDTQNWMLPTHLRETLVLSSTGPILAESPTGQDRQPMSTILGPEPARNWCYYFEKADLARQQGDWQAVVALGDRAFTIGDYPNDPAERFPFIEGYAHTGNWQRAVELTRESHQITNMIDPILCKLWNRIDQNTPASAEKQTYLQNLKNELECSTR